jgi:hypothetical protein
MSHVASGSCDCMGGAMLKLLTEKGECPVCPRITPDYSSRITPPGLLLREQLQNRRVIELPSVA